MRLHLADFNFGEFWLWSDFSDYLVFVAAFTVSHALPAAASVRNPLPLQRLTSPARRSGPRAHILLGMRRRGPHGARREQALCVVAPASSQVGYPRINHHDVTNPIVVCRSELS